MSDVTDTLEASFERVAMPAVVARPMLEGARAPGGAAFEGFLRSGASIEMKAFTGVSGDSGGYAVPDEIDAKIDATLKAISPIRAIANVVTVGSAGYRKLVTSGGTPSGWAAETDARTETATPVFNEIAPPMGELYANPSASQARRASCCYSAADRDNFIWRFRPGRASSTPTRCCAAWSSGPDRRPGR